MYYKGRYLIFHTAFGGITLWEVIAFHICITALLLGIIVHCLCRIQLEKFRGCWIMMQLIAADWFRPSVIKRRRWPVRLRTVIIHVLLTASRRLSSEPTQRRKCQCHEERDQAKAQHRDSTDVGKARINKELSVITIESKSSYLYNPFVLAKPRHTDPEITKKVPHHRPG